jgi:CRISPR-associated protein Cas1
VQDLAALVIHGSAQITTQALHLCAAQRVTVHWMTSGGSYVGALAAGTSQVQRRIRQYEALANEALCTRLARRLTLSRLEGQLRFILRATRGHGVREERALESLTQIRACLHSADKCESRDSLRGHEGLGSRAYFAVIGDLLIEEVPADLHPTGRSRRPPKDRFNALLSFGYALLYRSVLGAILAVGLEPSLGFYHTARSSALPLVLDLMELFRVSVWDMTMIASLNRKQWDVASDFNVTGAQVWLSDAGRRKAINLYEARLGEVWRHPVMGYSLSYARTMELEARLLEKEWTGKPGLFGRARIR